MKTTTVLFDLDGTLLPMDQDGFVKVYFGKLAAKLAPQGYEPGGLVRAIWSGTAAMVKNTGQTTNEEVFWADFCRIYGPDARKDEPVFEEFYRTDFEAARAACGFTPRVAEVVGKCRELGFRVALATNPIFPAIATRNRIRWAGLSADDFQLITTYENSCYCKPNPDYYREVVSKLGVTPEQCLMVGNDVEEDMVAAGLGMKTFLLTDCLINKHGKDISAYKHGSFEGLLTYLEEVARHDG